MTNGGTAGFCVIVTGPLLWCFGRRVTGRWRSSGSSLSSCCGRIRWYDWSMPRFFEYLPRALAEGQPFALGIISGIKGSSPQKKGAKALFYLDGRIQGTLGGGCLEAEIQDRARRALLSRSPSAFELVLDHDFGWDDGLVCGGKVCGLILPGAAD